VPVNITDRQAGNFSGPQAQVEGTTRNGITAFRPPPGEPEGIQELFNLFRRQCVW
jgi:hypothetical protein